MQIVSRGDNLHEMSNLIFWEKNKKNTTYLSSAENFLSTISTNKGNWVVKGKHTCS